MILRKQNWFCVSKFDSPWANLLSKFLLTINLQNFAHCEQILWAIFFWAIFVGCEQFFCRRQQQDNCAGRSSFEPARHETGNGFSSGRRVYPLIHDLPRIAGPSRLSVDLIIEFFVELCDPRSITRSDHSSPCHLLEVLALEIIILLAHKKTRISLSKIHSHSLCWLSTHCTRWSPFFFISLVILSVIRFPVAVANVRGVRPLMVNLASSKKAEKSWSTALPSCRKAMKRCLRSQLHYTSRVLWCGDWEVWRRGWFAFLGHSGLHLWW